MGQGWKPMSLGRDRVRPRLAIYVAARRHVVDGESWITLHDLRSSEVLRLGEREWTVLRCADGTRDIEGIIAAVEGLGRGLSRPHLEAFLAQLEARGLMVAGVQEVESERRANAWLDRSPAVTEAQLAEQQRRRRGRRVSPMEGYRLRCHGRGACCTVFATMLFSPIEALTARALCPDLLDGAAHGAAVFTPERSALVDGPASAHGVHAVAAVDGSCLYRRLPDRCELHGAGGAASKPAACRHFPLTAVDDGQRIKVSVVPECACVFDSLERDEGEPLVDPGVSRGDQLEPSLHVRSLPDRLRLTSEGTLERSAWLDWSAVLERALADAGRIDGVSLAWRLARQLEQQGVVEPPAIEGAPEPLEPLARGCRELSRAARRFAGRSAAISGTASPTTWVARTVSKAAVLADGWGGEVERDEAFYLRATFFGHLLVGPHPIVEALRRRAVRLLIARSFGRAGRAGGRAPESVGRGSGAPDRLDRAGRQGL